MSTRERRDYGRRSENYRQRGNQGGYGSGRGDQNYRRRANDNDSEQGEEARTLDPTGEDDFGEEFFEGEDSGGRNFGDEERYGSQGYGSQGYGRQGYGRQQGQRGGNQGSGASSGRRGQQRRYGDRRDQSYGAMGGDEGYGPDPRSGVAMGGAGLGGYIQGSYGSGQRQFSQGNSYESRLQSGGFRGKGPKGYQRSDERITEEVNQALADDDDLDASDIEVSVSSGEVTLTGTVSNRQAKRWAEDLVEGISGVNEVQNHLRVKREDQAGTAGQSTGRGDAAREGGKRTGSKAEG